MRKPRQAKRLPHSRRKGAQRAVPPQTRSSVCTVQDNAWKQFPAFKGEWFSRLRIAGHIIQTNQALRGGKTRVWVWREQSFKELSRTPFCFIHSIPKKTNESTDLSATRFQLVLDPTFHVKALGQDYKMKNYQLTHAAPQ